MLTVAKYARTEFQERKSKFISYISPANSKVEALEFIKKIKNIHNDARHNVYAYKIYDGNREYYKFSDDGEPQNTAGKPIAEIINLLEVNNLVIVVARYFGGIKLGAGGLIRNYAKAGKLAIEEAGIKKFEEIKETLIDFDYSKVDEVERLLLENKANITEKKYDVRVTYRLLLNKETIEKLKKIKDLILIET